MLVRIFGQEEAQIALSLPRRLATTDHEQRLKLLIHGLDGFRRFLEIKSMHDAVRTRYGNSKCRRPPTRADLPPHYKHGRLSRPQPFAGAAMVTIAALTTPNVIVFLSDIDRSVCWCRENAGLAEALRRSPRRGISRQDQCDEAAVSAPCCQRPELASMDALQCQPLNRADATRMSVRWSAAITPHWARLPIDVNSRELCWL